MKAKSIQKSIDRIKDMKGVKRLFTMTGEYDLLIEFEGDNTEQLHDFHFELDSVDSIEGVITNVVMKEFFP
ncbi:MAG: Lrp/AsnC ligand binding domain-containing protein [Promethearchaeota archaeon]